jgi:hypothetical protein
MAIIWCSSRSCTLGRNVSALFLPGFCFRLRLSRAPQPSGRLAAETTAPTSVPKPLVRRCAKEVFSLSGINRRLAGLHNCFPEIFHPVKFLRCSDILFAPLRVLANSHSTSTFGRAVSGLAVAPYPATSESERSVSFNQLNPKTGHRIKHAKGDTGTAGATAEL